MECYNQLYYTKPSMGLKKVGIARKDKFLTTHSQHGEKPVIHLYYQPNKAAILVLPTICLALRLKCDEEERLV